MLSTARMQLQPDEQAILMLCSQLGLPSSKESGTPVPFNLREWNRLVRTLSQSPVANPGGLLGMEASVIARDLGIATSEAERIARLLERGGLLAIELERLASRGIWATTRASADYPKRLRTTLRESAPAVLFGSGEIALAKQEAIAIVGSRDVDGAGKDFARWVSRWAVQNGLTVVSGAARGVDKIAMATALELGGTVIGVPADSLERMVRLSDVRNAIEAGLLLLLSPYHPKTSFSVGTAMGRNKIVYSLSNCALIVSSGFQEGGTWTGAMEALRAKWVPIFVRADDSVPIGNRALLRGGALAFPYRTEEDAGTFSDLIADASGLASARWQGRAVSEGAPHYESGSSLEVPAGEAKAGEVVWEGRQGQALSPEGCLTPAPHLGPSKRGQQNGGRRKDGKSGRKKRQASPGQLHLDSPQDSVSRAQGG